MNPNIFLIILSIILTGCIDFSKSRDEESQAKEDMGIYTNIAENASINAPDTLSDKDFQIKGQGTFIELESTYENMAINEKIVNVEYLDEMYVYDTYFYENCILSISPVNGTIFCIDLVTSEFKTARGVSVGDHISTVFEEYGPVDENPSQCYVYYYNYKMLTFYVDQNGRVMGIKLEMI